jgi:hypothetical protein
MCVFCVYEVTIIWREVAASSTKEARKKHHSTSLAASYNILCPCYAVLCHAVLLPLLPQVPAYLRRNKQQIELEKQQLEQYLKLQEQPVSARCRVTRGISSPQTCWQPQIQC